MYKEMHWEGEIWRVNALCRRNVHLIAFFLLFLWKLWKKFGVIVMN